MLEKFVSNPKQFKNIWKNLGLSFVVICLLYYLFLLVFGNLEAVYSMYFLIILYALFAIVCVFVPFIIRWIYLKEFYLTQLVIPLVISLILGCLIIHTGFNHIYQWEKKYFEDFDKKLIRESENLFYDEFQKEFVDKQSSKVLGRDKFIANPIYSNLTKLIPDDNSDIVSSRKGRDKVTKTGIAINELYYNGYVLDKNEPIVKEYLDLFEKIQKEIDDIPNSNEKYNFSNAYVAYFNNDKSQKLLYDKMTGVVKITANKGKMNYLGKQMLEVLENDSIDSYSELRRMKTKYDNYIGIFNNDTKYCEGLYELDSINIIFFEEIPKCYFIERSFKDTSDFKKFATRAFYNGYKEDKKNGNYLREISRFSFNPLFLQHKFLSSSFYVMEIVDIVGHQTWFATYQSGFFVELGRE